MLTGEWLNVPTIRESGAVRVSIQGHRGRAEACLLVWVFLGGDAGISL